MGIRDRAEGLGIDIIVGNHKNHQFNASYFGVLLQYPGKNGIVLDFTENIKYYKEFDLQVVVACDPMACLLYTSRCV